MAAVEGDLSDRHNGGHSVLIVTFEDGARVAYKPKDLRLDVAWHDLIARLNRTEPPLELMAPAPSRATAMAGPSSSPIPVAPIAAAASVTSAAPALGSRCCTRSPPPTCIRKT